MTILAIETSCDETAAAVMRDGKLLSNIIASQDIHIQYGGVVPELASRAHIAKVVPVVRKAIDESRIKIKEIDCVAATRGPGLSGSLIVGLTFAKGLALANSLPFLAINHIEGHLFSAALEHSEVHPPFLALIVSGGHTMTVIVRGVGHYEILGQTLDDAAGEAFDKVAKILGLAYPGGPAIEKAAIDGDEQEIEFPVAQIKDNPYDFSFSGLKTAVLYHFRALSQKQQEAQKPHVAASFQFAVIEALVPKIVRAVTEFGLRHVVVAGGVARNASLRKRLYSEADANDFHVYIPAAEFCTDNAAMIAKVAHLKMTLGNRSPLSVPPDSGLTLTGAN